MGLAALVDTLTISFTCNVTCTKRILAHPCIENKELSWIRRSQWESPHEQLWNEPSLVLSGPKIPLSWVWLRLAMGGIWRYCFVSFLQYFPHSSYCFPQSSQKFGKTSLWNKYNSLTCDFWKFVGKTHHSCKFLGHLRPNGPKICSHCECFPHSFSRSRAIGKWELSNKITLFYKENVAHRKNHAGLSTGLF